MKLTNYRIILTSNSPRRKELLSGIDVDYEVHTLSDIDESYPDDLPKKKLPNFFPAKSECLLGSLEENALLITADTIVLLHGKILGNL